jgi:hypothetical protein
MSHKLGPFPRSIVIGAVLTLAIVLVLSWAVGHAEHDEPFNWELAAIFGTALGTTLLAITTGGLAYLTGRDVSATQQLAQLQRDDQQARERPVVLLHSAAFQPSAADPHEGHISMQVFNAGLGPALRVRIEAQYKDPAYQPEMRPALWPAIMAGSRNDFAIQPIRFRDAPPGGIDPDGFSFEGSYSDRSASTTYPVIVEWRTSRDGAYGAFEDADST